MVKLNSHRYCGRIIDLLDYTRPKKPSVSKKSKPERKKKTAKPTKVYITNINDNRAA